MRLISWPSGSRKSEEFHDPAVDPGYEAYGSRLFLTCQVPDFQSPATMPLLELCR